MQQQETGTQTEAAPAYCVEATGADASQPPKTPQQRPVSSGSCHQPPKAPQQQQQRPKTPQQRPATAAPSTASQRLLSARPKTAGSALQPPLPPPAPLPQPQVQQKAKLRLVDRTPMVLSFNPDPRLRSWQRLEHMRLHQMGLSSKLSRRYNVCRVLDFQPVGQRLPEPVAPGVLLPCLQGTSFFTENERKKNDVAPFRTFQKPICGVFFSHDTDNKKLKHDLEATDLIKWRYFL